MSHVLIIDDEQSVCWGLERLLTEEGYEVTVCPSAEEGMAAVRRRRPDLALVDVRLPGMDGLTALKQLREEDPFPVVIITAYGSLDTAVQALERGAFDYLTKPFELEQVVDVVRRAETSVRDSRRAQPPAAAAGDHLLLGASPSMQEVFKRIALAAPTDAPVLIVGESGTGKELVAGALHRHSRSAGGPFVAIHAAALSPTLVESELFGHVRGAFTGADADRRGLLESAHGGTVFLDEAADIPLAVQVKLLRVLERHEIVRIGESQPRPCRIRILAAVNRDPAECVREGLLRKDLLYRLAAFDIRLPPLAERRADIPLLAEHFLRTASQGRDAELHFSEAAIEELLRRNWPGNVRELRNAVEHAAITARGGRIEPHHLPPAGRYESVSPTDAAGLVRASVASWAEHRLTSGEPTAGLYDRLLDVCEPPLFEAVLRATDGNRAAAADVLGIHRATLRKKLNEPRADDA
jgi:DNA-binding NtrC family response regulator